MKNIIGKFLCWIGIHKLDENDWTDIWEEDGYSGKVCTGQKNWCKRCGEYITRKEQKF
jgi:hypothetical protein